MVQKVWPFLCKLTFLRSVKLLPNHCISGTSEGIWTWVPPLERASKINISYFLAHLCISNTYRDIAIGRFWNISATIPFCGLKPSNAYKSCYTGCTWLYRVSKEAPQLALSNYIIQISVCTVDPKLWALLCYITLLGIVTMPKRDIARVPNTLWVFTRDKEIKKFSPSHRGLKQHMFCQNQLIWLMFHVTRGLVKVFTYTSLCFNVTFSHFSLILTEFSLYQH